MDWTSWIRKADPSRTRPAEVAPAMMDYTDYRLPDLTQLRHDHAARSRDLADSEARWVAGQDNTDAATFAERTAAAPRLLALREQVQSLAVQIGALERDIAATAAAVAEYAALTDAEAARVQAHLDLLARTFSDDELQHAYAASRQIETRAARLLAATGDRQFRRPRSDPHRLIREHLEDRGQRLAGLRLLRSLPARLETKTG